ncbi:S-adenosyl-L-methionine-dependent methyltransferase [Pleurotus eryngii]|uniref:S-adenosyl-L-methionine-dependent methyltransferase n=1 Tax=Pleurotus eryngii TaxID=5323 RepID=A0A9P5ZUL0_PLEER|nr:S-adenosyl-L-methionine-dependent methyltransferase [Pleurotus eryngii]
MFNERLNSYYKKQKIIPDDAWDEFMQSLRRPLPTTFRVAGSRQTAKSINKLIQDNYVPSLKHVLFEGQPIPPPEQLPWYPEGLAWQFNVAKPVLRKQPEFKKFHSFLVFETDVGNISRQEAVSMLPPLFLDVLPHHKVIDMCAAPGSKTAQLLEALHADDTATSTSIPPGLLIANDSDQKRTHMLIHQSARLPSPALMVTNLDASIYPIIKFGGGNSKRHTNQLLFDRILCDVPCSGDGTIRKNSGIWRKWQPGDGNGLHALQVRILVRAMRMLNSSGRIVYSTCSLNPVENEAVIAVALKTYPEYELVDVSSRYPELERLPGLTSWTPTADRTAEKYFDTYQEYRESLSSTDPVKLTEGHWPPPNAVDLNLTRCMRIYPHLQDTGGFFVAVLQKKQKAEPDTKERKREATEPSDVPEAKKPRLIEENEDEDKIDVDVAAQVVEDAQADGQKTPEEGDSKAISYDFKENPYTFLSSKDPILISCIKRLKLTDDFPASNILVRNPGGDAVRSLYLTNDIVKTVILNNDYTRIRLTTAGTKVFAKQEGGKDGEAQFRVLGEGLPVVLPYMDRSTIMDSGVGTLRILLKAYHPACASFEEPFRSQIESKGIGNHIFRVSSGTYGAVTLSHDIILPIWKSSVSISLMVDKKAKSALSLRLFGLDITVAGLAAQQKKIAPGGEEPEAGMEGDEVEDDGRQ